MNEKKKGSGLSVASMILGIVGLVLVCLYIGIVPCVIGLALAIAAFASKSSGKGMAVAGLVTSIVGILFFILILVYGKPYENKNNATTPGTQASSDTTESSTNKEIPNESKDTESILSTEPSTEDAPTLSMGQKNALKKADLYLSISGFSYSGLVRQLEFEGFTNEEATFAADNCGADWNEQAARKAKSYLDIMPLSRDGLIQQLEFEGFTTEQAEYGVTKVGY